MSIDWRRTLKKDGLANGWEWGGIKEFVTKKILPVKGGRHQDLSISKKQPPCHDFGWSRGQVFISLAIVSKWAISFQMEMFLTYIFSTISHQCNLLPLDLAGKKQLIGRDVHFTQYHMCQPGKQRKSDFLRCLSLSSHHNKIIPLFDIFQSYQENSKLLNFQTYFLYILN